MATKRRLERRISSTEDMASIVGTMKALAAVNVRVFDRARESIDNYLNTVERGLQIVLRESDLSTVETQTSGATEATGLIVFGSVQGMCGQFNAHIAEHTADVQSTISGETTVIALGDRLSGRLADYRVAVDRRLEMAGRIDELPALVDRCILETDRLRTQGIRRLVVCYNREEGSGGYESVDEVVLPIADRWIQAIRSRSWPTHRLPTALTPLSELVPSLVRQYLFSAFYRAAAQSLAAENAARLRAMESAESNIDDQLEDLQSRYNRRRQAEITEELLDIVGGYTALEEGSQGAQP